MRQISSPPSLVPQSDSTVYIVQDDLGNLDESYRETDVDDCDLEAVIRDLIDGQFHKPIRIIAFNTEEGWASDVSKDIAREVVDRALLEGEALPRTVRLFCERHFERELPDEVLAA
jgi:hypothetical protein